MRHALRSKRYRLGAFHGHLATKMNKVARQWAEQCSSFPDQYARNSTVLQLQRDERFGWRVEPDEPRPLIRGARQRPFRVRCPCFSEYSKHRFVQEYNKRLQHSLNRLRKREIIDEPINIEPLGMGMIVEHALQSVNSADGPINIDRYCRFFLKFNCSSRNRAIGWPSIAD